MMRENRPIAWHWQRMNAATLGEGSGITPTQNIYYKVIQNVSNLRLKSITTWQTNDEAALKTLQVIATIDGVATYSEAGLHSNNTKVSWGLRPGYITDDLINAAPEVAAKYVSWSIKYLTSIQVRITSAVGTNQLLFCSVQYEQLKRVIK